MSEKRKRHSAYKTKRQAILDGKVCCICEGRAATVFYQEANAKMCFDCYSKVRESIVARQVEWYEDYGDVASDS